MKKAILKINKTYRAQIIATTTEVVVTLPKQNIGTVCLSLKSKKTGQDIILHQWELVLAGADLKAVRIA